MYYDLAIPVMFVVFLGDGHGFTLQVHPERFILVEHGPFAGGLGVTSLGSSARRCFSFAHYFLLFQFSRDSAVFSVQASLSALVPPNALDVDSRGPWRFLLGSFQSQQEFFVPITYSWLETSVDVRTAQILHWVLGVTLHRVRVLSDFGPLR